MAEDTKAKSKTTTKKATKEVEKVLNFKLGQNTSIFATPDGSISLSRFTNNKTGSVAESDIINYRMIMNALYNGRLIQVKEGDKPEEKDELIDIGDKSDRTNKYKSDAAQYLRKLRKPQLLERITKLTDPQLIAVMIEQESFGRNVSRRKRDDVIEALKERLEVLQKDAKTRSGMVAYTEADELKSVEFNPKV